MFTQQKLTADFTIDPTNLREQTGHVINDQIVRILSENKIQLKLNVFDSDPSNTTKPVMVLLHGNSASKKVFDEHVKHYSKNYRVIAVDLLGHGDSTKISNLNNISEDDKNALCEAFYNPSAMMAEVAQCLKSRGVTNAHIIGWSLGGHIAYGIAKSNPELVASIVSIGSPPVRFSSAGFKKGFSEWFVTVLLPEWVNKPKVYPIDEAKVVGGHIGFNEKDIGTFAQDMAISDPQMRRNLFLKLNEYDAAQYDASPLNGERFVQETDIPLCLMVGEKDAGINAIYIASMREKLRHSQSAVHIVENAPHALFKTHSEQYYQIVDSFIDRALQLTAAAATLRST